MKLNGVEMTFKVILHNYSNKEKFLGCQRAHFKKIHPAADCKKTFFRGSP